MTRAEEKVIMWACNLAEAVVAGDWRMPRPMCLAINHLQDAAEDLAFERGWKSPRDGCSKEFLREKARYWREVEEKLKKGEA